MLITERMWILRFILEKTIMPSNTLPTINKLAEQTTAALEELKAEKIKVYNVTGKISYADCIIICNVNSLVQARAAADRIQKLYKNNNIKLKNQQKHSDISSWNIIDSGDLIVHIFLKQARDYYDIDAIFTNLQRRDK